MRGDRSPRRETGLKCPPPAPRRRWLRTQDQLRGVRDLGAAGYRLLRLTGDGFAPAGHKEHSEQKRGKRQEVTQRVMGWESRQRGGLYYTRSRKENGRVVREYIGSGVLGQIAALEDEHERRRREEQAAYWREEQQDHDALQGAVEELSEASDFLVRAALLASGYRQHNRGEWRLRREPKKGQ